VSVERRHRGRRCREARYNRQEERGKDGATSLSSPVCDPDGRTAGLADRVLPVGKEEDGARPANDRGGEVWHHN